jgi:hypothetical protein
MATREEEKKSAFNPTILGRPLFPSMERIGQALSGISSAIQRAQGEPMMADSGSLNLSTVPVFPKMGPLVRTSRFSGPPSERPDFRDPAQQWDARPITPYSPATVGSGRTISTQDAIAQNNANMTDNQRGALGFLSLSPSSAGVVRSVSQAPSTGIAGGQTGFGLSPSIDQDVAAARFGAIPSGQSAMAPVTANIQGAAERKGVQTAYGMVYPAAGQEAGAERSAALGPMGARLANVRQDLNQQDRIAQMRERGAALAQQRIASQEEFFAQKASEREGLRGSEMSARASGVRPMDIMKARAAAGGPTTIAGIQEQAYERSQRLPMEGVAASAVSKFTENLPQFGSRPLPVGPMGPSGYALYEQQRMAGGSSNPYSNVRAEQRRRTRDMATSQGIQPATNYQSQLAQEDYFRRRGLT